MKKEKNLRIANPAEDRTIKYSKIREFISEENEKKILKWARQAVVEGQASQKLAKRIYDFLKEIVGDYDFIEIDGQAHRLRKYAELIARTEIRKAQTEATLKSCAEFENDLVEISHHQTNCEICKEFEGKVYSISGKHGTYPKLEKTPPFHLGCRHSMLPTSDEAIEVRKKYL